MTLPGPGSVTRALTKSLVVGLSLLWLLGVVGSGVVLKRLIDEITGRTEITNPRENPNLIKISYSDSDPQRASAPFHRVCILDSIAV